MFGVTISCAFRLRFYRSCGVQPDISSFWKTTSRIPGDPEADDNWGVRIDKTGEIDASNFARGVLLPPRLSAVGFSKDEQVLV